MRTARGTVHLRGGSDIMSLPTVQNMTVYDIGMGMTTYVGCWLAWNWNENDIVEEM
jgi:hypothetical protein